MNERKTLRVDGDGELEIGGCKATELAGKFGTPLYVFDEAYIRDMMRVYREAMDSFYDGHGKVLFASKAFSCLAMYKIAAREKIGVDIVSGGELYTAYKADFPMKDVFMHGNSKTDGELEYALDCGVGTIVIDCIEEAEVIDRLACDRGIVQSVLIRVNPGIEAHTHAYVQTATPDSKFGFPVQSGAAEEFTEKVLAYKHISLEGFHCHIGSQIFEKQSFAMAAEKMIKFIADVKKRTGFEAKVLNMGGGFGIHYVDSDPCLTEEDYADYLKVLSDRIKECCERENVARPYLVIEPGRSIVGEAGVTLYTVNTVKDIPGVKRYVAVDGGMGDNPRYALYQSEYTVVKASDVNAEAVQRVSVAGKCCESGDIVAADVDLPPVSRGDILAVLSTGAYNYSMASNYNRNIIPGAVLVCDGKADVIIERQTYEDLIRNDTYPDRLR